MLDNAKKISKDHVFIVEDDKGRTQVILTEKTYSLGRANDCSIKLRSPFVSRYHAVLIRQVKQDGSSFYEIVDGDGRGKESANGLLINGARLSRHSLEDGDEIVFGPQVFAIYEYRGKEGYSTQPSNDPFDITLIDPSMMDDGEETTF